MGADIVRIICFFMQASLEQHCDIDSLRAHADGSDGPNRSLYLSRDRQCLIVLRPSYKAIPGILGRVWCRSKSMEEAP